MNETIVDNYFPHSYSADVVVNFPVLGNYHNSKGPDQNGVSLLFIMLEIHHSGREPSFIIDFHTLDS